MGFVQNILQAYLALDLLCGRVLPDCSGGNTVYTSSTGTITSPGWPDTDYTSSLDCVWFISFPAGSYPSFIITNLNLENSDGCTNDYLQFIDGGTTLAKLCGSPNDLPKSVAGLTNIVLVKFVTNNLIADKGFRLRWFTSSQSGIVLSSTTTSFNITTTPTDDLNDLFYMYIIAGFGVIVLFIFVSAMVKKKQQRNVVNVARVPVAQVPRDPPPPYQRYDPNQQENYVINATAPPPPPPDASTQSGPLHIMISYQWDFKQQVRKLKERLQQEGYRVWIDVEQMHKSATTYDAMAIAIKQATVVVPVLSKKYPESENCRKEIQFAYQRSKPLVPVRLDSEFSPNEGWLGELLGNTVWYDLSDSETYEQQFTNFLGAVANLGGEARMSESDDPAAYEVFPRQQTMVAPLGLEPPQQPTT